VVVHWCRHNSGSQWCIGCQQSACTSHWDMAASYWCTQS